MFDPELYRDKAEVAKWMERGPIHGFTRRLKAEGLLTEEEFLALESAVAREIESAVGFAESGSLEPVEELLRDVRQEGA
jgi:pyruvate dehydrogenase E1 component alpha subunit